MSGADSPLGIIAANSSRHMSSPGDRVTRWRWLLPTNRLGPADYDILGRRPWDGRSSATLHSARPTPASPGPLGKGTGGPKGRRGRAAVEASVDSDLKFSRFFTGAFPLPCPPPFDGGGEERIQSCGRGPT